MFEGHKYVNLETFRRSGEGVKTPLWFAEEDGVLYARTFEKTGKAKRLRRNPKARVAPCDMRGNPFGEWVEAEARLVEEEPEVRRANELLNEKYGLLKRLIEPVAGLRHGEVVTVAIRPETSESDGARERG